MQNISRELYEKLKQKYNLDSHWYIEYPHKSYWTEKYSEEDYKTALKELFATPKSPALLYLHMPYCQTQCYFCTCRVEISVNYDMVKSYLEVLFAEIDLYRDFFKKNNLQPNFKEIHLGGGSPTYLKEPEFESLVKKLGTLVNINELEEFAIEVDPRRVKPDRLLFYADQGLNRISFGIQDFDKDVQKAINRLQPAKLIENLLTPEVRRRFKSVNFDILCGLPGQTKESFRNSMKKVVELGPDRVSLFFFEFSPKYAKHMLLMPQDKLVDAYQKKDLFLEALPVLEAGGYIRTGYDMFAKATDAVAQAKEKKKMSWNSLGSTPGRCLDMIALGVHSYGRIGPNDYSQNVYELEGYKKQILSGHFPVFRGHRLSPDDVIRRDLITKLKIYFRLDLADVEKEHGIEFRKYFAKEIQTLQEFANDGMVELTKDAVQVTELGKQYANIICASFDAYLKPK